MFLILGLLKSSIIGLIPVIPMAALFHFIMLKKDRKTNHKTPARHVIATYIFCFVLLVIFNVTSIPTIFSIEIDMTINLKLFDFIKTNYIQYILNIILFIPLGFMLPLLWKKYRNAFKTIICGAAFSLFIEITQMFSSRITDINDLLMNTIGTIVGFIIFIIIRKSAPKISIFSIESTKHWKSEPFFYFVISFISMFFFYYVIARSSFFML